MKTSLSDHLLSQLSDFIESNLALYFPKEKWNDLERNITNASKEFGYPDVISYIHHILSSPMSRLNAEQLASHLTISETYFWREALSFKALEETILPEVVERGIQRGKRLRIWSVGCSGGEEPYSIAIALSKFIPNHKEWNISILATDFNPKILQKAKAGIYGAWSFRSAPAWLKEKYFRPTHDGKHEIIPEIKQKVNFEYLNLAEDIYPSPQNNTNAMDIIYCRNVLMYFNQKRFRHVAKGLYNSLVEGGYLIVSSSELSTQNFPDFEPVNLPGIVLYQKISKKNKKSNRLFINDTSSPIEQLDVSVAENEPFAFSATLQDVISEQSDPREDIITNKHTPISEDLEKLYNTGNYHEVINKLQKEDLNLDEQMMLIRAYANTGKLDHALNECQKSIDLDKLDPKMHYLCATIMLELNQKDDAITTLKKAIYIDPEFALSYYSLGNLYLKKGNLNGAKKCFHNILSILEKWNNEDLVPESEGITTGRFREIINATIQTHAL